MATGMSSSAPGTSGRGVRVVPIVRGERRFSAMVKPVGPRCNLDCAYCYYLNKDDRLGLRGCPPLGGQDLEKFIRDYIDGNDLGDIVFEWQGGEPTLLGLDYFRAVVELQRKFAPPHRKVFNNLQTNGTLLDKEWCRFLRDHRFLVGLSLDGPRELHDAFRKAKGGEPTFDRVVVAAELLKRHGVGFNTLTVVNRLNARRPLDVYRFLTREIGPRLVQFIPCVERKGFGRGRPERQDPSCPVTGSAAARPGTDESILTDWSVDPDDFGAFLSKVFDDWHNRDIGRHHVNLFESFVGVWAGLPPQICVFNEFCGKSVMVERDGSVYSCDHFASPEHRLGCIRQTDLVDLVFSSRQVVFGHAKSELLPAWCRECRYLGACYGECPKNRLVRTPDGKTGLNYLCPGLKRFFAHADERLQALARQIRRQSP